MLSERHASIIIIKTNHLILSFPSPCITTFPKAKLVMIATICAAVCTLVDVCVVTSVICLKTAGVFLIFLRGPHFLFSGQGWLSILL